MFKQLPKSFKALRNASAISIAGILGTVFFAGVFGFLFILPSFEQLGKLEKNNETDRIKLNKIQDNVTFLSSLDKQKIATLSATIAGLMPAEPDQTRAAALVSIVAQASGGRITNLQTSEGGTKTTTKKTTTPTSGSGGTGSSSTPITKAGGSPAAKKTAAYSLEIKFAGSYQALKTFLVGLRNTDRAIEVNSLQVAPDELDPNGIQATMSFILPLDSSQIKVNPEEPITFSPALQREIEILVDSIMYEANPTSLPLKRPNPFRGY